MAKEIPVYLFTGFLEAGKTRFIQETLEDPRFNIGDPTLLLLCEQGEEEYAPDQFCNSNVFIETVEAEADLTAENLAALLQRHNAVQVLVEYNGMWSLDTLFNQMPEGWVVAQEFMFADAGTFQAYNANMRQLVYDKLKSCEMVVFNRYTPDIDKMELHKIVRGASRRADIAYEAPDGRVTYDDIEDPLPFDLTAPVVEIADEDFAIWYRDMGEELDKYDGLTVRFKGLVAKASRVPSNTFIIGRRVMTCCIEDVRYMGLAADWSGAHPAPDSWVTVTATVRVMRHKAYGIRKGPVLKVKALEQAQPPQQEIASFM